MSCKCRQSQKIDNPENYNTMPDEPCIYCGEKHFSTALRLAHESGYEDLNRQHIIGELVLAQWHLAKFHQTGAMDIRNIRHLVQTRQENQIGDSWRKIGKIFDHLILSDITHGVQKDTTEKKLTPATIYIFSNVKYPEEKKIIPASDDMLVFLNKAQSVSYYSDFKRKLVYHRSPKQNDKEDYGGKTPGCINLYVFEQKPMIPASFIANLKKNYDWDYEIEKGAVKSMTTGYMVVQWMHRIYPNSKIVLVNFGYEVKNSTYRCPWHNWKFEAEQLKAFEHIYTAEIQN